MHPFIPPEDDLSLIRLEILGNLARAARLALLEFEQADRVQLSITAEPSAMQVDCTLMVNGVPVSGWGA